MSRSRSYFSSSARSRRSKRRREANVPTSSAPTPFGFEVAPRNPEDWADWSDEIPRSRPRIQPGDHDEPRIEIEGAREVEPGEPSQEAPISSASNDGAVASVPEPSAPPSTRRRRNAARWRFAGTVAAVAIAVLGVRERAGVVRFLTGMQRSLLHGPPSANAQSNAAATPPPLIESSGPCPGEMAYVERDEIRVCVDKWEGSVAELFPGGDERPYSPYLSVEGHTVVAISKPGVVPQGYISRDEAEQACALASKRLCSNEEWKAACEGPSKTTYPYGATLDDGACNTHGKSPISELFSTYGDSVWDSRLMNDPSLNALDGTVAKTGSFPKCTNGFGVFDMVGNLHEWTADKAGVFRGGYYQDAENNGSGCNYTTGAHFPSYHDYSTGFRCCRDPE